MKNQEILSIIIPIYNIENFICDCINSIEKDIDQQKIEIICINDGSTDSSEEKLNQLKKIYDNIILINQENSGVSTARNTGMRAARGNYIWFVDGDDYIVDGFLPFLLKILESSNDNTPLIIPLEGVDENSHAYKHQQPFRISIKKYSPPSGLYSVIIPTSIAKKFTLDSDLAYGEDYFFTFLLSKEFKKAMFITPFAYCYRKRSSSAMNNTSAEAIKRKIDSFITLYYKYDHLFKNAKSEYCPKELSKRKRQCIQACLLTLITNKADCEYTKATLSRLKSEQLYPYNFLLNNLIPSKSFSIFKINLLSFLFPIEKYFWFIYRKVKK